MPLQLIRQDITQMRVDAIVNSANRRLVGGSGVNGAIHRAAGPELLEECLALGGCETGEAKITRGYRLPCRYVIHTVGPVWRGGNHGEKEALMACYQNSLALAQRAGCESIAFPLISSGVFGYPQDRAMKAAVEAISDFLLKSDTELMVYLLMFSREAMNWGSKLYTGIQQYIDDTVAFLGPAIDRNFQVWEASLGQDLLMPAERNVYTHAEAVAQLKEFCTQRGDWLDQHIETVLQFGHSSKVKQHNLH